ncbi:MAG TPA: META domain-containing protein [Allosphingosinicella sp.]
MIRFSTIAAALVAGTILSAAPLQAQPSRASYRALGTEPFWSVTVQGGRMVYEDAERRRVSVRVGRPMPMRLGYRYDTRRLSMTVFRGRECSDGMSDRRYADTVRVRVDGRSLEGCGGAILPPATLADTSWRIVTINGADVSGQDRYEMRFEADRMSGRAGCNSFNGTYRVSSDGFQAGPLAMTRMACPGARMEHEQTVSRILAGRVRLYYPDGDTLLMRGVGGGEIRLRRSI